MKVTVTKYLNVRVGKPSVNAPCYQYLAPGSEIDVDGQFYRGDTYDGIDTWVKDEADNYYWSGGIEMPHSISVAIDPFKESNFWWLTNYKIGELWSEGLSGKGIKIAVLDSGLSLPHPDLIVEPENLQDLSGSQSGIIDYTGHGTHVSGIIKASNNGFGVKGIAFNAEFYFGKISNDIRGDKVEYLLEGIRWAIKMKVDIISISQGFSQSNDSLELIVNEAVKNNVLLVCAAGNKDETTGNNILYPASYPQVLSVGGVTASSTILPDTINAGQTDLFAPGEKILSTHLNGTYLPLSGSSQSAPYVAGVACLLLEAKRKSNSSYLTTDLKNSILSNADQLSFGRLINPLNTLKNLV